MLRSLRARFLLASVGIATLPVLFLGIVAGLRSAAELERQSLDLQTEIATRIERDVTAFVSTRLNELQLLERTVQLADADDEIQRATLARLLAHNQVFQSVMILARNGRLRAFASRTGVEPESPDQWTSAPFIETGYWDRNAYYVGPIKYDASIREPLIEIGVPVFIRKSGTVEAILFVRVRFKPIWDLLADLKLPTATEAFVVGPEGRVVAHPSPTVVLSQSVVSLPDRPGRHPLTDGQPGLVVWQPLSLVGSEARVVVMRSVETALASANAMLMMTVTAVVVLLVVAALAALQQARMILRPIESLARAARKISDGDLDTRIEPSGPEEISTLGTVLGAMTKRLRQTISKLERSEYAEKQRALVTLESIGDAVITTDTDGLVVYINPVAEGLTGWNRQEAQGRPLPEVFEIINRTTREPCANPVELCLARNTVIELANNTILVHRDGRESIIADSAAPIREPDGAVHGVVLVFRDVTESEALEKAVRQSQKMDAIGQLTGGIAHDFNNLLQVIQGNAELIQYGNAPVPEASEAIIRATNRGSDLTARLLSFGRRQILIPRAIDIGDQIDGFLSMLSRTIGEPYTLSRSVAPGTWQAWVDPGQLEAALLNLMLNARDAMPTGGRIEILARNASINEMNPEIVVNLEETDFIAIDVVDKGTGMTPETISKAVEPFYTTKGVGAGSGLGLSMVYGFVKQSRGAMEIASQIGTGSTVTLFLPRARDVMDETPDFTDTSSDRGQGDTILVVEDNAGVRDQTRKTLEALGYHVVMSDNVAAARIALGEHPEIALVLTDVVMPGSETGYDLCAELAQSRPGMPVCLMSGYVQDALDQSNVRKDTFPILQKPFSRSELAQRVSCLIGR